ncbi:MAG TPA: hypothetical protein VF172_08065 [Nitrososphaera sp.]
MVLPKKCHGDSSTALVRWPPVFSHFSISRAVKSLPPLHKCEREKARKKGIADIGRREGLQIARSNTLLSAIIENYN